MMAGNGIGAIGGLEGKPPLKTITTNDATMPPRICAIQ
jgi:hypothetical protein